MSSLSYAEQLRNDLFRAYEDARKNKRNTIAQLEFEKDAEHNLIELYHELLDGSYVPGKSICFLTHFPVLREVFASQFRDRVVHHLLFNYIAPIFEKTFIYDSYSCRKEKGTLFGVERLEHQLEMHQQLYTYSLYPQTGHSRLFHEHQQEHPLRYYLQQTHEAMGRERQEL